MERVEVAIVGAGAAGLAAARELRRLEHRAVVLEARGRIGGRILTRRQRGLALPIELGAEFIHGDAPQTARVLSAAGLLAYEVTGSQRRARRGTLRPMEFWGPIDRVLQRIDPSRPDESFARFLARRPGGRALASDRSVAREFVQGFHAADPDRIGVCSIAPEGGERPSGSAAKLARVLQGYDSIPRWLARDLGSALRLRARVIEIRWRRGMARLTWARPSGERVEVEARTVIITVPLGVLQHRPRSLILDPDPARVRAAVSRLAMGSAVRVVVWFQDLSWLAAKSRDGSAEEIAFLHTPGACCPVWWTARPMRAPLLVGWAGGPPAAELSDRPASEIPRIALRDLARALGIPARGLESRVRGAWTHSWEHDSYARGAYSYARVHGSDAHDTLARPVDDTLFFAGEATDATHSGTVEGALRSGVRAAQQVARALGGGLKRVRAGSLPP